ncbi:MAG: sigma-70 family RNA polymerase sigma factor [Candidatus Promineifilaceae bacterium]
MYSTQLFQRAENGDTLAQGELFRRYYPSSYRLAYSLLNHQEDAEEVAQDTLTYALMNLSQFDSTKSAFTSWLYTITVSRCRNKRRRKQLAEVPLLGWLVGEKRQTAAPVNPPEQSLTQQEEQTAVYLAIQELPEKQREAVILRYYHDLSYGEIGEIVGCSANTAQSRVWLAQKRLYGLLSATMALTNEVGHD